MNALVATHRKRAVVLINLGTPDAPTPDAIRRYYREFLSDPRVVDLPALGRWLLLNLVILPFRPSKTAPLYQSIWRPEGSPLLAYTREQERALQARLPDTEVMAAMRYGHPSLENALRRCDELRIRDITVVPMFPQEASATTGSIREAVYRHYHGHPRVPSLRVVAPFFNDTGYVDALVAQWRHHVPADVEHVVFSYHGLPERQVRREDGTGHCLASQNCCDELTSVNAHCYRAQCLATTRLVSEALASVAGVKQPHTTSFQSRLGRVPWLRPYTDQVVDDLARQGVKRVALLTPGFVTDCLETLEELGHAAAKRFVGLGGERLTVVPCLNADTLFIDTLARLAAPHPGSR